MWRRRPRPPAQTNRAATRQPCFPQTNDEDAEATNLQPTSRRESHFNVAGRADESHTTAMRILPHPRTFANANREGAALFRELIAAGYGSLAFQYHPDDEGSVEAIQGLNRLIDRLIDKLRRGVLAA